MYCFVCQRSVVLVECNWVLRFTLHGRNLKLGFTFYIAWEKLEELQNMTFFELCLVFDCWRQEQHLILRQQMEIYLEE